MLGELYVIREFVALYAGRQSYLGGAVEHRRVRRGAYGSLALLIEDKDILLANRSLLTIRGLSHKLSTFALQVHRGSTMEVHLRLNHSGDVF